MSVRWVRLTLLSVWMLGLPLSIWADPVAPGTSQETSSMLESWPLPDATTLPSVSSDPLVVSSPLEKESPLFPGSSSLPGPWTLGLAGGLLAVSAALVVVAARFRPRLRVATIAGATGLALGAIVMLLTPVIVAQNLLRTSGRAPSVSPGPDLTGRTGASGDVSRGLGAGSLRAGAVGFDEIPASALVLTSFGLGASALDANAILAAEVAGGAGGSGEGARDWQGGTSTTEDALGSAWAPSLFAWAEGSGDEGTGGGSGGGGLVAAGGAGGDAAGASGGGSASGGTVATAGGSSGGSRGAVPASPAFLDSLVLPPTAAASGVLEQLVQVAATADLEPRALDLQALDALAEAPEPATVLLVGSGILWLGWASRRGSARLRSAGRRAPSVVTL